MIQDNYNSSKINENEKLQKSNKDEIKNQQSYISIDLDKYDENQDQLQMHKSIEFFKKPKQQTLYGRKKFFVAKLANKQELNKLKDLNTSILNSISNSNQKSQEQLNQLYKDSDIIDTQNQSSFEMSNYTTNKQEIQTMRKKSKSIAQMGKQYPSSFRSNLSNFRNKYNYENNSQYYYNNKKNRIQDSLNLIEEQSSPQKSHKKNNDLSDITMENYQYQQDLNQNMNKSKNIQQKKIIEPFPKYDKQAQNIFQQQQLLEGFKQIGDKIIYEENGNLIQRYIVGTKAMFNRQLKIQQEKLFNKNNIKMMGSRFKKNKQTLINSNNNENNMGQSDAKTMLYSMNQSIKSQRTALNQQNHKSNIKQINQEIRSKQDLFKEMEAIKKRIENIRIQENQQNQASSKIVNLLQTQQERVINKYQKQEDQWNKLQNYYQKVSHKTISVMDLEKQRKINEIKNQFENQSVINSYGTNTAKWQYSLRKEEPSLKQLVPSKSANNIMGQDQQKIITEPPKRKLSFKLQNDLPNGFRTSGQSFHLRQIEQVRNPFSITTNNFFNSVRSKSELKPHETKHNFYSKDFIDKQQRQFEPEFENLYIAGKSQYQKEIEMLENTKQNYFRQQLQEQDQNFQDSKNDQEVIAEVYDTKTRAKKLQLDEIQSEHQSLIYSKNHSLYKPYQSAQQSPNTKFGSSNYSKNVFLKSPTNQKQFNSTTQIKNTQIQNTQQKQIKQIKQNYKF